MCFVVALAVPTHAIHSAGMSVSSLATVVLQLIMHSCNQRSLLMFARCCKHTLAAAQQDFAWCYESITIRSSALPAEVPPRTVLRYCSVTLFWGHNDAREGELHRLAPVLTTLRVCRLLAPKLSHMADVIRIVGHIGGALVQVELGFLLAHSLDAQSAGVACWSLFHRCSPSSCPNRAISMGRWLYRSLVSSTSPASISPIATQVAASHPARGCDSSRFVVAAGWAGWAL